MKPPKHILPLIVLSQFLCTSLWFAGNAVLGDLMANFGLTDTALGHLTSAVQLGFIAGTLLFALFTITDRYSPSKVFMVCATLGAGANLAMIWDGHGLGSLLTLRFLTGFFLAGIYPVGMKIAADYYTKGLGQSLGYLVGALVLGTAFPHWLRGTSADLSWHVVLLTTSGFAILGGLLMRFGVADGPYRQQSTGLDLMAVFKVFKNANFRSAAFGYFGHMWELYAFWAFVPVMLTAYIQLHPTYTFNIPMWSFAIIAIGGLACVGSGYLSAYLGAKRVAFVSLLFSGLCCLVSPWLFTQSSSYLFLGYLLFWGMAVVADSPLFSTLVAQNTSAQLKGTALTIVNCLGFSISIVSILLVSHFLPLLGAQYSYILLAIGPIVGLIALSLKKK
ncbi:MFS transporter [Reichenbachiella carrageenanivorans]|uniref:MFS transporter n=1 Tax=Reichenbachiella carrageenanivorans TaxID=2979869 RepID=A0ABY6D5M4_9BACT|nr:MFS transporter [Reichenbachiella carrageenanivorans]UXX80368.1 MFS transporter [Reichenbachiella carrageenanivorans]